MIACTTLLVILIATSGLSVPIADSHSLTLEASARAPRRPRLGSGYVLKCLFLILKVSLIGDERYRHSPDRHQSICFGISEPAMSIRSVPKVPRHHVVFISLPSVSPVLAVRVARVIRCALSAVVVGTGARIADRSTRAGIGQFP